jgi:glucose-6-phosphate isomerase
VQAGKVAADAVLKLQLRVADYVANHPGQPASAEQIAQGLGLPDDVESIFKICQHLAANQGRGVERSGGRNPANLQYQRA